MLTRIWTGFLLSGLCASLVALVVVYMHEKGVYPFRDAWGKFRRQPWGTRIAIAAFVVSMWVYASVKPGDGGGNGGGDGGGDGGGTNNVEQVESVKCKMKNDVSPDTITSFALYGSQSNSNQQSTLHFTPYTLHSLLPIASTNTTRTLTGDDFRRGVVMTRIGTDEEFDFSPIANATIVSDWRAFGAAIANVKCKV